MSNPIKILLAEDEPSLGQIIKESLETRNFEVLLFADADSYTHLTLPTLVSL